MPEVVEALAFGQEWDDDTRIVLLRAAAGRARPRRRPPGPHPAPHPRRSCRPATCRPGRGRADIPRTRSGKLAELAVRPWSTARSVRNTEALANPEALDHYRDLPELAD